MDKLDKIISKIAVILVIGLMAAVPLGIWYYKNVSVPAQYPPGTKIINLMAYGRNGQWTLGTISGANYWRGAGGRLNQVEVNKGDNVVFRITSADVQHIFSIPELKIKPAFVKPGYLTEVQFVADKAGAFTIQCLEFCSPAHEAMSARFVVKG
ncbi:MAG: hypothetical protein ROZ36_19360 [Thermincola sp.]|nr:hypothetical protein [Thermincola sp.]